MWPGREIKRKCPSGKAICDKKYKGLLSSFAIEAGECGGKGEMAQAQVAVEVTYTYTLYTHLVVWQWHHYN